MNHLRLSVLLSISFVPATPPAPPLLAMPFLRGDANGDRVVDVSDVVRTLFHLFQGVEASCEDTADFDDDGLVDIIDVVFGLEFLFLGGPEPPFPGTQVAGFDATPRDPFLCGDPPPSDCETRVSSSLPGAFIDVSGNPCALTLAEAAAGVMFRYAVVVERALADVASLQLDAGQCDVPGESGLRVIEGIFGGDQSYCLCDVGRCVPAEPQAESLAPGRYDGGFEWTGQNWSGPSDFTPNPQGPPFPPGRYQFEVRARGVYLDQGREVPFEIRSSLAFDLVP